MRGFAQCAVVSTLAAAASILPLAAGSSAQTAQSQRGALTARDPAGILAAARSALGGEQKLSAVKSFTTTGRTRQVRGENLVPIEFEIFVELPDKYVRKDEIPAQESGPTSSGFNGEDLLQDPPPPPMPAPAPAPAGTPRGAPAGSPPAGMPVRNPSAARVTALKQDFTRLLLGMFASSSSAYPLTFAYVAEAEAPQGKADVLEGKGPNNFALRLFISRDTHLPVMVTWQGPAGRGPGGPGRGPATPGPGAAGAGPPAGGAPGGERGAAPPPAGAGAPAGRGEQRGAAPPAAPENRLYFAEYHEVDGMQFPFRLRRAVGTETVEETTFDRFRINAKIDPKRFEVHK